MLKLISFLLASLLIGVNGFSQTRKIDSLKQLLETGNQDTTRANILHQLAKEIMYSDPEYYLSLSREQKQLSEQLNYPKGVARGLVNIANYYNITLKDDSAFAYYNKSLNLNKKLGELGATGKIYYNLGNLHYCRGTYDSARYYFKLASPILSQVKDYKTLAWIWESNGLIFRDEGNYDSSLFYLVKALGSAEATKDSTLISQAHSNIGFVFKMQKKFAKALEYTLHSLRIYEKINDNLGIYHALGRVGDIYSDMNDSTSALNYYRKAIALSDKVGKHISPGMVYFHIGAVYRKASDYDKALHYYFVALQHMDEGTHISLVTVANSAIGAIYLKKGEPKKAIKYFNAGLDAGMKLKLKPELAEIHSGLAEAYFMSRDFKKAYEHKAQYHLYQDSVYNMEKEKAITEIEEKYKAEKKEQQIIALKQSNQIKDLELSRNKVLLATIVITTILISLSTFVFFRLYRIKRKAAAILEKTNHEKETLLKEIHHRVKNNLQLVISLLEWQADDNTNADVLKMIHEGRSRVESMALIHELLYQNDDLGSINFRDYTRRLCSHIQNCYKPTSIVITQNVTNVAMDIKYAIPLALIINELVTNSFKYAFPDHKVGEINVTLSELERDTYQLVVRDNGKGLDSHGLNDSLGLQLVHTLVKQLKGTLTIENNPGASFSIFFAIKKHEARHHQSVDSYA